MEQDEKKENTEEKQKIEQKIGKREEKIKNWLKDPYNLILIGILIFAFLIRLYYFFLTKNQPLWWDESEYMATAKSYAGIGSYNLQGIRTPGFPLLMSIFFILGITNELTIRFFALFIPSIILISLTYLVIKEMYPDRRVALISTLIISVLWEHLFYSNRFHIENFALIFQFLAFYILFKGYLKKQNIWFIKSRYSLFFITLFSIVSVFFRPGNVMFIAAIFLFLIILNKNFLFKKKKGILLLVFGIIIAIIILLLSQKISSINNLIKFYLEGSKDKPLAWQSLTVFYGFYQSTVPFIPSVLFWSFILGLLFLVFNFYIKFDKVKNITNSFNDLDLKSDVFNFILILLTLSLFIFVLRTSSFEYRWFFPFLTGMLVFTAKGLVGFSETLLPLIGMNNKKIISFFIIIVLSLGIYTQLVHADNIIKIRLDSYKQVKESGLWIKESSSPEEVIISASVPQHSYYSERKVYDFYVNGSNENESAFNEKIKKINPKYLVISVFEPGFTPQWAHDWPQRNNETIKPVQVYFLDKEQKQLTLIIYEYKGKDSFLNNSNLI